MKNTIRSVLIIANADKSMAVAVSDAISGYLAQRGIKADRFIYAGVPTDIPDFAAHDLAITLGGDGTVLFASRVLAGRNIPILPVNLGDFGFISEVGHEEWRQALERYETGDIAAGARIVLDVCLQRKGQQIAAFRGLNDAVIAAAGISKIVRYSVHLSRQYLGAYRADGIIVATPTGSTAYSAAAGGPILHPEMEALILNPICPHTLSHRPIVLPPEERVQITLTEHQRTDVALTVDGQSIAALQPLDVVTVVASDRRAHIVRSDRRTFYEVLRNKLNWAGGPDD